MRELVYAFVICRIDIGYAICFLSRFSGNPHDEHFKALKGVCKYLRATKNWGIIYQREKPLRDLPVVPLDFISEDPTLPAFPQFDRHDLIGLLDAAHGTDLKTRRSVTGLVILLCGAAIAWKSRPDTPQLSIMKDGKFYKVYLFKKVFLPMGSRLLQIFY